MPVSGTWGDFPLNAEYFFIGAAFLAGAAAALLAWLALLLGRRERSSGKVGTDDFSQGGFLPSSRRSQGGFLPSSRRSALPLIIIDGNRRCNSRASPTRRLDRREAASGMNGKGAQAFRRVWNSGA
jgi:hypothetical protein